MSKIVNEKLLEQIFKNTTFVDGKEMSFTFKGKQISQVMKGMKLLFRIFAEAEDSQDNLKIKMETIDLMETIIELDDAMHKQVGCDAEAGGEPCALEANKEMLREIKKDLGN